MSGGDAEGLPDPIPWRELVSAFEAVKLADAFKMAAPGTGIAFVERFADDPDNWCGTRGPGWPLPKGPGRLDRPTLGAALELVARGLSDDRLAGTVREAGQRILG